MIGRTLGGRYEVIQRVGGGGMALVYKARDLLLDRFVALKVLRPQFAHDEEFVRRFRREARSAASLSHPNIVGIYDVGQDGDDHYIVMEYVEGRTLNDLIRERAPFQPEEAVHIAVQICEALEHAHQNQIIHRDIKPHNILIGKNGRVKVTDFGIARAVTAATITQTGSVVGSVHYFSPEHAKGVATGEKSDIYSLGIVLYQMVTGRLPFLGESPISVALKHLQEPFETPRRVNPHIPQSLENIIVRAMRKDPRERYQSAREMREDLETCLRPERLHEAPLEFADEEAETTRVMPAIRPAMAAVGAGREAYVPSRPPRSGWSEQKEPERGGDGPGGPNGRNGPGGRNGRSGPLADEPEEDFAEEEEYEERRRGRWIVPVALTIMALAMIGALVWGVMELRQQLTPRDIQVPDVIGKTLEEARAILTEAGLQVDEQVDRRPSDEYEEGIVIDQSKQGIAVKEGSLIRLTVSSGPEPVPMPDLQGMTVEEAKEVLASLGVTEDRLQLSERHANSEPGTVVESRPAAREMFHPKKDTVSIYVSLGPEEVAMPSLVGSTLEEARAKIEQAGLVLPEQNIFVEPSFSPKGTVFKQFPAEAGEKVAVGTEVQIWVSGGFPENTVQTDYPVTVSPVEEGKPSVVRILVSDAMGDNREVENKRISAKTTFWVPLVLSPDRGGQIVIYVDNRFYESYEVPYSGQPAGTARSAEGAEGTVSDGQPSGEPREETNP
ncbi:MAG TPA: Stk1 family PASTA domain-containing Ser/Thr kinase [Paenibacillaceae bacterium]